MGVVNDVLDFSKIEGQACIENTAFDLAHTGQRPKPFEQAAQTRACAWWSDVEPMCRFGWWAIRCVCRRCSNNLPSNAIKFTEQGETEYGIDTPNDGVRLAFSCRTPAWELVLSKQQHLFQPFAGRRIHHPQSSVARGAGDLPTIGGTDGVVRSPCTARPVRGRASL